MSDNESTPQVEVERVRLDTVAAVSLLDERGSELELPGLPEELRDLAARLDENRYTVLVVGEAKRGKSSFLNALIGHDLLPTDLEVATSRAFLVQHGEAPAFRLRFEDGSAQDIAAEDLSRYGSQAVIDRAGGNEEAQALHWIEVELAARFLPEGVRMVDTPGLGSVYAAHAEITHRFLPHADAVILVLDSVQPILEEELSFLERILEVTGEVFFVQTKIDLVDREAWEAMRQRNESLLRERFGDRLRDPRVWPVSSQLLSKAGARAGDQAAPYLKVSRHDELTGALRSFLTEGMGRRRTQAVIDLASSHQSRCERILGARLTALAEESRERRAELRRTASERLHAFEEHWGRAGGEPRRLAGELKAMIGIARKDLHQALHRDGAIDRKWVERTQRLHDIESARELYNRVPAEVTADVAALWQKLEAQLFERVTGLLTPLGAEIASPVLEVADGLYHEPGDGSLPFAHGRWEAFKGAYRESMPAVGVAGIVASFAGFSLVLAIPALIAGWVGWTKSGSQALEEARKGIRRRAAEVAERAGHHFFDADFGESRMSRFDDFAGALERSFAEQIGSIVESRRQEMQQEIERIGEQERLDLEERRSRAESLRGEIAGWRGIGQGLGSLSERLEVDSAEPVTAAS